MSYTVVVTDPNPNDEGRGPYQWLYGTFDSPSEAHEFLNWAMSTPGDAPWPFQNVTVGSYFAGVYAMTAVRHQAAWVVSN